MLRIGHPLVLVFAAFLACGWALTLVGPFDGSRRAVTYEAFLADYQAGRVGEITRWRDRLEVELDGSLVLVTVPAGADLMADLGRARIAGGRGLSLANVPDVWPWSATPLIPVFLVIGGAILWLRPLVRRGRPPQPNSRSATPA